MYKTMIVPIDGSESSFDALQEALKIAKESKNAPTLKIVHIKHHVPLINSMGGIPLNMDEVLEKESQHVMDKANDVLKNETVTYEVSSDFGDPASIICEKAETEHADLIVMGSRGLGPFREVVLGSVSSKVLQRSKVPVLIVK
ncbi:universal stress protein [Bacillaceae bacterium SIJ1]|uniref:universal stress protein n=1 Tax=Litoribacterium kuwaitense TaxID=1398745 RepID=UPI0013EDD321|nr:universal stress protein [Litoribacterium kuwaitense]NGP46493.1 universal stress protein [Litoribacterium kuwaitense]